MRRPGATLEGLGAILALSVGASAVAGCVGSIDDPEPFFTEAAAPDCAASDIPQLLERRCATEGCHDSTDRASGLVLEGSGLAASLVGRASDADGDCADRLLIDPDDPTESLLAEKVSTAPTCGSRMPLAGSFLSRGERSCLADWIAAAARSGAAPRPDAGSGE